MFIVKREINLSEKGNNKPGNQNKPSVCLIIKRTAIPHTGRKMKHIFILLMVMFLKGQTVFSQGFDPVLSANLQNKLDSFVMAQQVQGITAAVKLQGAPEHWAGVSGYSHSAVPVTAGMLFGIGSNTKLFTAVAILKLTEAGVLELDDSLYQWLPVYPNIDSTITLRQLLNHTSGLNDYADIPGYRDSMLNDPNRVFTPTELVTWVDTPLFAPGTGWDYCNTNYLLAGMVVEAATNQSLGTYLHQVILDPLQLDSTFLAVEDSMYSPVAHPWINGADIGLQPRTSTNSAAWAAGAMYSTAGEMVQWYDYLFSGLVIGHAAFWEMTTLVPPNNYGMGISQQVLNGRTVWGHTGNIRGYLSCFIHDQQSGISVTVIINDVPSNPSQVASALLSEVLNSTQGMSIPASIGRTVSVFPNPANEEVMITGLDDITDDECVVQWYNSMGQLVMEGNAVRKKKGFATQTPGRRGVYGIRIKSVTGGELYGITQVVVL